jgi:hypothetical protein
MILVYIFIVDGFNDLLTDYHLNHIRIMPNTFNSNPGPGRDSWTGIGIIVVVIALVFVAGYFILGATDDTTPGVPDAGNGIFDNRTATTTIIETPQQDPTAPPGQVFP